MNKEQRDKIVATIHQLSCLTHDEWVKVKLIVDECFARKEREFKKTLELPTEEIDNVIRARFG